MVHAMLWYFGLSFFCVDMMRNVFKIFLVKKALQTNRNRGSCSSQINSTYNLMIASEKSTLPGLSKD